MEANNQVPENDELNEQELDEVTGGIIIVGGKNITHNLANQNVIANKINLVALNPQPLPPRWH